MLGWRKGSANRPQTKGRSRKNFRPRIVGLTLSQKILILQKKKITKLLLYLVKEPLMEQNLASVLALKWKQMVYMVAKPNRKGKPGKVRSEIKVWIVNCVNRNI